VWRREVVKWQVDVGTRILKNCYKNVKKHPCRKDTDCRRDKTNVGDEIAFIMLSEKNANFE